MNYEIDPNANPYGQIFIAAWHIMEHEFSINGFTISYAKVFLFSLLCILVIRAICLFFKLQPR